MKTGTRTKVPPTYRPTWSNQNTPRVSTTHSGLRMDVHSGVITLDFYFFLSPVILRPAGTWYHADHATLPAGTSCHVPLEVCFLPTPSRLPASTMFFLCRSFSHHRWSPWNAGALHPSQPIPKRQPPTWRMVMHAHGAAPEYASPKPSGRPIWPPACVMLTWLVRPSSRSPAGNLPRESIGAFTKKLMTLPCMNRSPSGTCK